MNTVTNFNHRSAIITEALTVAEEHMAWCRRRGIYWSDIAEAIGRPRLGYRGIEHKRRRAIMTAAIAAEWMGLPR